MNNMKNKIAEIIADFANKVLRSDSNDELNEATKVAIDEIVKIKKDER